MGDIPEISRAPRRFTLIRIRDEFEQDATKSKGRCNAPSPNTDHIATLPDVRCRPSGSIIGQSAPGPFPDIKNRPDA